MLGPGRGPTPPPASPHGHAPAPPPLPPHDPYAALRLVDYRRFLIGGIMASAGAEMQVVAVGWELYERTGSATALGLVGLVMVIPVILLALPAGTRPTGTAGRG